MFALTPLARRMTALLPRTETPFGWLPEELAPLFNRFFTAFPVMETPEWPEWIYPRGLTMEEREKEVVARMEVPGFEPGELKVEVLGGRLTVEAEHREPAERAEEPAERAYAHVRRTVTLPPGVEAEKAEAVYRNGVLEVHVPRIPEAVGRRIEVKV